MGIADYWALSTQSLFERLLVRGKFSAADVLAVALDGADHLAGQLGVAADEAGLELRVDAQHVVCDEDLTVTAAAGADAAPPNERDPGASVEAPGS